MSSLAIKKITVPSLINRDEFFTPFSYALDNYFDEAFPSLGARFFSKGSYPKVDVSENDTSLEIVAEIPGLNKDQVKVELHDGVLSISGEKKEEVENKKKNYIHKELKHSSFYRSFVVGENVNETNVDAKFENGVLTINLPKTTPTPKPEPKKIEIR